ncbi:MAG: hypothetical protein JWN78_1931 [Bacteroidota bacterium]|nr:hypothetical protein [Bacteroidota bacterium]
MEEKDKLKDFIRQHRSDFEETSWDKNKVWNNLEDKLFEQQLHSGEKKIIPLYRKTWIRVAAAAIIIGIAVFIGNSMIKEKPVNQICSIQGVPAQFCSQVSSYEESLFQKYSKLDKQKLKQVQIPDDVLKEIEFNNPEQQRLLKDLKNNPQNQNIQDAILEYYKAKLKLINKIEESVNKKNTTKNETNTYI